MPKKAGIVLLNLGAVLILSALLLFLYNDYEDDKAGQSSEYLLHDVQAIISERVQEHIKPSSTSVPQTGEPIQSPELIQSTPQPTELPELTAVEIDGYGYIGYLSIPDLDLELPIMSDWDYERLKMAPCRQFGSTKTDDLVIAAHNYTRHFGRLADLQIGATVTFTDMNGNTNIYAVTRLETIVPESVDVVQNSDHDLVLYTCTYGGKNRVAVFCDKAE